MATYNLKAFLLNTGLKADTVRAWERRYGIPSPSRTVGGHRIYSDLDLRAVQWLKTRQAQGFSISRAVEQWLVQAGDRSVPPPHDRAEGRTAGAGTGSQLAAVGDRWLSAALSYDEPMTEEILSGAFALYAFDDVVHTVLLGGLRGAGAGWQDGTVSVAQEHFVSSLVARKINALIAASPVVRQSKPLILACPPSELHSLPLQFLHLALRRSGKHVLFLGADVPLSRLIETAREVSAAAVLLSAQSLIGAANLQIVAEQLASQGIPVGYGGRPFELFPALQRQIRGGYLGSDLRVAVAAIGRLIQQPIAPSGQSPRRLRKGATATGLGMPDSAQLRQMVEKTLPSDPQFADVVRRWHAVISAALQFGDLAYAEAELPWLGARLRESGLSPAQSVELIAAHAEVLRKLPGIDRAQVSKFLKVCTERLGAAKVAV